jgi:hypothetical protein
MEDLPCILEQQKQLLLAQWRWDESEPCVEAGHFFVERMGQDRSNSGLLGTTSMERRVDSSSWKGSSSGLQNGEAAAERIAMESAPGVAQRRDFPKQRHDAGMPLTEEARSKPSLRNRSIRCKPSANGGANLDAISPSGEERRWESRSISVTNRPRP